MWLTTAGLQQGPHEIRHVKCLVLEDASNILVAEIWGEYPPIAEFSNFYGVNYTTLANFKLPM